jgi:hypothetical protein
LADEILKLAKSQDPAVERQDGNVEIAIVEKPPAAERACAGG